MLSNRALKKGTQVVATIDIVTSVLSFISLFFLVFLTIVHGDRLELKVERDQDKHPELAALFALGRGLFIIALLVFMIICIFFFYLARYLLHAATEGSYKKIHRWTTITLVIIITRAAFFITAVFFTADTAFVSSFGFIGFLYQLFCLWFVRLYEDRLIMNGSKNDNFDNVESDPTSGGGGTMVMDNSMHGGPSCHNHHHHHHFNTDLFTRDEQYYPRTNGKAPCNFSQQNELHGQKLQSCGHLDKK